MVWVVPEQVAVASVHEPAGDPTAPLSQDCNEMLFPPEEVEVEVNPIFTRVECPLLRMLKNWSKHFID
jgi:hypothetical protein